MTKDIALVGLLALAGFLVGGVYTSWQSGKRIMAGVLAVAAALALGGAVAWYVSK